MTFPSYDPTLLPAGVGVPQPMMGLSTGVPGLSPSMSSGMSLCYIEYVTMLCWSPGMLPAMAPSMSAGVSPSLSPDMSSVMLGMSPAGMTSITPGASLSPLTSGTSLSPLQGMGGVAPDSAVMMMQLPAGGSGLQQPSGMMADPLLMNAVGGLGGVGMMSPAGSLSPPGSLDSSLNASYGMMPGVNPAMGTAGMPTGSGLTGNWLPMNNSLTGMGTMQPSASLHNPLLPVNPSVPLSGGFPTVPNMDMTSGAHMMQQQQMMGGIGMLNNPSVMPASLQPSSLMATPPRGTFTTTPITPNMAVTPNMAITPNVTAYPSNMAVTTPNMAVTPNMAITPNIAYIPSMATSNASAAMATTVPDNMATHIPVSTPPPQPVTMTMQAVTMPPVTMQQVTIQPVTAPQPVSQLTTPPITTPPPVVTTPPITTPPPVMTTPPAQPVTTFMKPVSTSEVTMTTQATITEVPNTNDLITTPVVTAVTTVTGTSQSDPAVQSNVTLVDAGVQCGPVYEPGDKRPRFS